MPKKDTHTNQTPCSPERKNFPFRIAAPSWLLPGTVSENCAWIADNLLGCVDEIALMLLETDACIAYTDGELLPPWFTPRELPEEMEESEDAEPSEPEPAPVTFHAHLPLDLPWEQGLEKTWRRLEQLLARTAPLNPRRYVLHPPPEGISLRMLAGRFAAAGIEPRRVLLENVQGCDLTEIWPEVLESGFGACVDLGHILLYGQYPLLALPGLGERVDMLHLSAPDPARTGRHRPLTELDDTGRLVLGSMLDALTPGATVVLEVFDMDEFNMSLRVLLDHTSASGTRP
ncbi:MAG: cobamide remodeling phosphodiesterase CbiR [Desulfovibrio sp.]